MIITECKNANQWNQFLLSQPSHEGLFLQSWEWGEMQRAEGKEVQRLALEKSGEITAAGLFVKEKLPLGFYYWYCGRGPLGDELLHRETIKLFVEGLRKDKKCLMMRWELPRQTNAELEAELERAGFILPKLMIHSQSPNTTLVLDLQESEKELLVQMKQKTRYNIKLAERHGVRVEEKNNFEMFWQLLKTTSARDKFQAHPRRHYEQILSLLPGARLCFAKYQEKILAAYIMVSFGNATSYLHGATASEHRQVMAPYALQWEEIKKAKRADARVYDFWGINSLTRSGFPALQQKSWEGFTRFKLGFGGRVIDYPGARDLIFQPFWYTVLSVLRGIKSVFVKHDET